MKKTFNIWVEKFRPTRFADIVVPSTLQKYLGTLKEEGETPNLLFSGPAGSGKCFCKEEYIEVFCDEEIVEKIQSFINKR